MKPPFMVYSCRILPDINILVSGFLSKCINLGHFEGFEIVIPTFILDVVDLICGKKQKKGASNEIDKLSKLQNEKKLVFLILNMKIQFQMQTNLK